MKKIFTTILLLAIGINSLQAQSNKRSEKKPQADGVASRGNNIINVYYGYNLLTAIFKNAATNANSTDVSVKSFGPVGLVYEHLVVDRIGLGAEIGYGSTTIGSTADDSYYDPNSGNTVTKTYNYNVKFSTLRAMFRANFHFINAEKFDAYGFVSAGYRSFKISFTSNDPNYTVPTLSTPPIGIKPGIGLRYFFIPALGLNVEMAIGTPIISGGLSFKF